MIHADAGAFSASAQADLDKLFEWIADRAGLATALAYTNRIQQYCSGFEQFPERGTRRDDLRVGSARWALNAR